MGYCPMPMPPGMFNPYSPHSMGASPGMSSHFQPGMSSEGLRSSGSSECGKKVDDRDKDNVLLEMAKELRLAKVNINFFIHLNFIKLSLSLVLRRKLPTLLKNSPMLY